MARNVPSTFTFRTGKEAESWNTRKGVVVKNTVRVKKGQAGAGQFQGATNLRGSVIG